MNLYQIKQEFNTEKECHDYLISLRWPDGAVCTCCSSKRVYRRNGSNRFKCRDCNHSFSVTVGTVFHASRLPLSKWFLAISQILAAKKGISSLQLARTIDVNKNTAWYMQQRLREAMSEDVFMSGIIEADETYIGGALGNMKPEQVEIRNPFKSGMGHKSPVLGMYERKSKKVNLVTLGHANGETIKPQLLKLIDKSSELVTDGFGGYQGLDKYYKKHVKTNNSKKIRRIGDYHLNNIEGFFSTIKRAIFGQYHVLSKTHLQGYLDEIAFKKNYPFEMSFDLLLKRSCAIN